MDGQQTRMVIRFRMVNNSGWSRKEDGRFLFSGRRFTILGDNNVVPCSSTLTMTGGIGTDGGVVTMLKNFSKNIFCCKNFMLQKYVGKKKKYQKIFYLSRDSPLTPFSLQTTQISNIR